MEYAELVLHLSGREGERFEAAVIDSPVGVQAEPDKVLYRPEVEPLLQRLEAPGSYGHLTDRELVEMGELLGEMLLPPGVRELLRLTLVRLWSAGSADRPGLRLVLRVEDRWLESLPWEYSYMWEYRHLRRKDDGKADLLDGFLTRDPRVSMVRWVKRSGARPDPPGPVRAARLNVVFALADPGDLGYEVGRPPAARAILRTVADVGEWAGDGRSLRLEARLNHRLDRTGLEHLGRAAAAKAGGARPVDGSALPELLADEGGGGAHSRALATLADGERDLTPVHVLDFRGHGGMLPTALVGEDGRLRLRLSVDGEARTDDERDEPEKVAQGSLRTHRARRYRRRALLARLSPFAAEGRRRPGGKRMAPEEPAPERDGDLEQRGMLVLEDEDGGHRIVWAEEAGESLRKSGVSVLLLDTCRAGHPESGPLFAWSGLGASLVEAGMPAVVGTQRGISTAADGAFKTAFYAGLLMGASVDEAVSLGRSSVASLVDAENPGSVEEWLAHRDWGVLVLYRGTPEPPSFAPKDLGTSPADGPAAGANDGGGGRSWAAVRLAPRGGERGVFRIEDGRGLPVKRGTKVTLVHALEGRTKPFRQQAKVRKEGKVAVLLPAKLVGRTFRTTVELR